jgi:hypothetical protein
LFVLVIIPIIQDFQEFPIVFVLAAIIVPSANAVVVQAVPDVKNVLATHVLVLVNNVANVISDSFLVLKI